MCPIKMSLNKTLNLKEVDSRRRDKKSCLQQTQISFALLRRQKAEHKALADATKPLKTSFQPGMHSPNQFIQKLTHSV